MRTKQETMEDCDIINYSGIFLSYIHKDNCKCSFSVGEHTLIYLHSGVLEIEEQGKSARLSPGECAFIRKDHRVTLNKYAAGVGNPYQSIALSFSRKFLLDFYRQLDPAHLPEHARRSRKSLLKIPSRPDVISLFQSLTPYFQSNEEPDNEWIDLKMREGLKCVLKTDSNVYASLFDFAEPWKIDLMAFMNENYMYNLSMEELANYTGRSLSTFKRDFKKVTNTTPQKWLIDKRLTEAHRMLSNERLKIREVMIGVGFSNFSFFSRSYKAKFGYPPASTELVSGDS